MEKEMTYTDWKKSWQDKYDKFPKEFAFSKEQLKEGLERLGVESTDEVISIGCGGFIRKTDVERYKNLNKEHKKDKEKKMENDKFVVDMFLTELANHEYGYTMDWTDALFASGISLKEFEASGRYQKLMAEAIKEYEKGEKDGKSNPA